MVDREWNVARQLQLNEDWLYQSALIYEGYARQYQSVIQEQPVPPSERQRDIPEDEVDLSWDPPDESLEPLRDMPPEDAAIIVASSFVLAASYRSIIQPEAAVGVFDQAARVYRQIGHPFSVILAICSDNRELVLEHVARQDEDSSNPDRLLYDLLAGMYALAVPSPLPNIAQRRIWQLREQGQRFRLAPSGRLGLPWYLYDDLAEVALSAEPHSSERARMALDRLLVYLRRVDEVVAGAMSDQFHWRRLYSSVLPLEPEVLATSLIVDVLGRRLAWWSSAASRMEVARDERLLAPMIVSGRMLESRPFRW